MEYTKEQINKLEELLYERAVDDNDDISHHAITYINELKKQLKLYSVVNRREQLLAFAKWFIQQENINSTRPDTYVDDFLESQ